MAGRRLSAEEAALWARLAATVTAIEGRQTPARHAGGGRDLMGATSRVRLRDAGLRRHDERGIGVTLDSGWNRRLARGVVAPERTIDLHGHSLAAAHAALDHALERAASDGVRVLLVVTGRAPRPGVEGRGLIRAAIGDWLAASRHAARIAAVRGAHLRHGGAGALYLILRRARGG